MAFEVRINGPEFFSEENTVAFLRIEESIRQYAAHSREPISLIRRPLSLTEDHFVLLWPRGAALVGMYPYGGKIRGSIQGNWIAEQPQDEGASNRLRFSLGRQHAGAEHSIQSIENPYASLMRGRVEFLELLKKNNNEDSKSSEQTEHGSGPKQTKKLENGDQAQKEGVSALLLSFNLEAAFTGLTLVALFTGPVLSLDFEESGAKGHSRHEDSDFRPMTVEYATSRTIVHLPNLLRVVDKGKIVFSNEQIESISNGLEHSAQIHAQLASTLEGRSVKAVTDARGEISRSPSSRRAYRNWLILLLISIAIVGFYAIHLLTGHPETPRPDSTAIAHLTPHPPSEIIIELPSETQLFVSTKQYQTRSELDEALAQGEGQRFLPDTEQIIVMDSTTLAKGLYGYFKVDNAWRKGKLLQTLEPEDTITIVKFLDPLP